MQPKLAKGTYVYGPFNPPVNDVWYIVRYDGGIVSKSDLSSYHFSNEQTATEYAKSLANDDYPFAGTLHSGN